MHVVSGVDQLELQSVQYLQRRLDMCTILCISAEIYAESAVGSPLKMCGSFEDILERS